VEPDYRDELETTLALIEYALLVPSCLFKLLLLGPTPRNQTPSVRYKAYYTVANYLLMLTALTIFCL